MEPYYEQDGITIYNADCREVLPWLVKYEKFDLTLTDPPFGIDAGNKNFGKWRTSKMPKGDWDKQPPDQETIEMVIHSASAHIIWGGNYFSLPPSRFYLVWDKGEGFKGRDFAECELAWCSLDANARIYKRDPLACGDYKGKVHPTQKPLALMRWCLGLIPDAETIVDPFMGSGTTLLAAKMEGKLGVGIEINEKYCEAAVNRLAQGVLF